MTALFTRQREETVTQTRRNPESGVSFQRIKHWPAGRNKPPAFRFADDTEQSDNLQTHFRRFLSSLPFIGEDQVRTNLKRKGDSSGFSRVQFGLQAPNRFHVGWFSHGQTAYGTNICAVSRQFFRHNAGN